MEKINIEQVDKINIKKRVKDSFIDLTKELAPPPIAMGIGYHTYKGQQYLNTTFTYGEMSAIIAPQKTKKSFFKSALEASYIGGTANEYFPNIVSRREGDRAVLSFDTEQGEYFAQRTFKRVAELTGSAYKNYFAYGLKKLNPDESLELIDYLINTTPNVGWVSIDGIADLCYDTNNIIESRKIIDKLKQWTAMGIHINLVIHKTFDKDKGTGHLGSYVQKKCETTIFLKSQDAENLFSPVEVRQKDSRGVPFETFYFDIDTNTALPKECGNNIF